MYFSYIKIKINLKWHIKVIYWLWTCILFPLTFSFYFSFIYIYFFKLIIKHNSKVFQRYNFIFFSFLFLIVGVWASLHTPRLIPRDPKVNNQVNLPTTLKRFELITIGELPMLQIIFLKFSGIPKNAFNQNASLTKFIKFVLPLFYIFYIVSCSIIFYYFIFIFWSYMLFIWWFIFYRTFEWFSFKVSYDIELI